MPLAFAFFLDNTTLHISWPVTTLVFTAMFVEYCFHMKMQIVEIHTECQSSDMQVIFKEESFQFSDKEELLPAASSHRAALHSLPFPSSTAANSLPPFRSGCNSHDKKQVFKSHWAQWQDLCLSHETLSKSAEPSLTHWWQFHCKLCVNI